MENIFLSLKNENGDWKWSQTQTQTQCSFGSAILMFKIVENENVIRYSMGSIRDLIIGWFCIDELCSQICSHYKTRFILISQHSFIDIITCTNKYHNRYTHINNMVLTYKCNDISR